MVTFDDHGLGERLADYQETWDRQRALHAEVSRGAPGRILYVEHAPVYTAGRRTTPDQRPQDGTPVIDVDRGGLITYHGPGQLVGYPIVRLREGVGVVDYVRALERGVIDLLTGYGLGCGRVEGRTGVWLPAAAGRPERKICAIGVRVARRTTMHGFALNVLSSAERFTNIIACGIADAGVTSLAEELDRPWNVRAVADDLRAPLLNALGPILD